MRSLDRASTSAGVEVMQVINREVMHSIFGVLLLSMFALSLLIVGYAGIYLKHPASGLIVAGGMILLIGVFGVSGAVNVPMNTRLDGMDHALAEAAFYWKNSYFPKWTFWNHVRVIACLASASCYLVACSWLIQKP